MADSKKGKRNKGKAPKADEAEANKDGKVDAEAKETAEADEKVEAAAKTEAIDEDEASAEEAAAHGDDEDEDDDHAGHDHGHDDHAGHDHGAHAHAPPAVHGAHAAAHAHAHKPNIKEYMVIFVALAVLTALEVGVTKVPGVAKGIMTLTLVGLALTKAAIVALYYMHLKYETRVLKLTVALPMAAPTIYAFVLISEAAWRLTR
jgi:cytochrome c oxidase subunit IV